MVYRSAKASVQEKEDLKDIEEHFVKFTARYLRRIGCQFCSNLLH
jgi:hypothetical protein